MTSEAGNKAGRLLEQHYTPAQLGKRWGLSDDAVRELFRDEDDVLLIDRPERMHKRGYTSMRIPESVAERVYARLAAKRKRPTSLARVQSAEVRRLA